MIGGCRCSGPDALGQRDIRHGAIMLALQAARKISAPAGPFEVNDALWARLGALAEKTFVPETDASRAGGAGAGLTDND